MQKPPIDFLVAKQETQLESTNPLNLVDDVHEKKRLYPIVLLRY